MRVLLIEDDTATAKGVELLLEGEGFEVHTADLGQEGLDLGESFDFDVILLDLNLPDLHGHEVLQKLRRSKVETPLLILSGLTDPESKIRGFGFGADDYLTKPFDKRELIARINAVMRRAKGQPQTIIETGELTINLDSKAVEISGEPLHLTGKEYSLLEFL